MNASLPPSSSSTGIGFFAAARADQRGAGLAVAVDDLHGVLRVAERVERLVEDALHARRRPRDLLGDLHHHRVAREERRDGRPEHVLQRVVPRADDADDAERLVEDRGLLVQEEPARHALGAEVLLAVRDRPAELLADRPDLAHHRVLAGLAGVADHDLAELVRVVEHVGEDGLEEAAALREGALPPALLRDARPRDLGADHVRPVHRHLAEGRVGGRLAAVDDLGGALELDGDVLHVLLSLQCATGQVRGASSSSWTWMTRCGQ